MSSKLLAKTAKGYILFAILLLCIAAPSFYFFSSNMYNEESNESLKLRYTEFNLKTKPSIHYSDINQWNRFNLHSHIDTNKTKCGFTDFLKWDITEKEHVPYRKYTVETQIEGQKVYVSFDINLVELEEIQEQLGILFISLLLLFVIGIICITFFQNKRLWKPFYIILGEIEKFDLTQPSTFQIQSSTILEFEQLALGIERLFDRNNLNFKQQREFVDHASHEMQTPLAILQAKIEQLLQTPNLKEEQIRQLAHVQTSMRKLSKLNKNLLLLSSIDYKTNFKTANFDLSELISTQIDLFKSQTELKNIQLEFNIEPNFHLNAHLELSEIVFSNLISNAIRHTNSGSIQILLTTHEFEIRNTANGAQLDQELIFKRFHKDANSEGFGLGLAIVEQICRIQRWKITYSFEKNEHIFSLRF